MQDAQLGAVSFLHRFGSSLNAHFHFHVLVIDGVFSEDRHGEVRFHEASCLQPHDWERLQITVQHRVLRYFRRNGLLDEEVTEGMLTWQGTGGFSIDASVRIEGPDRQGIERLARIYELLPLLCPSCGGEMRIISFLTDPSTVRAILRHLDLPHRPPPLAPARAPPQVELSFDQTPDVDPAEPESVPEFVFDQSLPDEFEG